MNINCEPINGFTCLPSKHNTLSTAIRCNIGSFISSSAHDSPPPAVPFCRSDVWRQYWRFQPLIPICGTALSPPTMRNAFDLDIRRLCAHWAKRTFLIPAIIQRGRCVTSAALSSRLPASVMLQEMSIHKEGVMCSAAASFKSGERRSEPRWRELCPLFERDVLVSLSDSAS